MQHHRDSSGEKVFRPWHAFRENARRTAFSKEEFSEIEQSRYDLDTAGITGEDNPQTYQTEPYGSRVESTDVRDHRGR